MVSHVVGNILGAGLGLVGVMAALVLLVRGPAPVAATVGAALTVLGGVATSVFFAAAYAQPAIGRAHLAGRPGAEDLYDDVYGTPLLVVFGVGALLFMAEAVVLGRAVARTAPGLRWAGYGYAASLVLFLVSGLTVSTVQPVAGAAAVAVAATMIARRLPASVAGPRPWAATDDEGPEGDPGGPRRCAPGLRRCDGGRAGSGRCGSGSAPSPTRSRPPSARRRGDLAVAVGVLQLQVQQVRHARLHSQAGQRGHDRGG